MSNFNNQEDRDTQIKDLPRLTFQLPQSPVGQSAQNGNILFCQAGCNLEFNFNNIRNAKVDNADNLFTITPTDSESENFINWNGTGREGMNSIRFDLKEIYFQAPAKDVVGQITYNKSIQYYFAFVNEQYNNIMITISVIGQANNVGNEPETNGFVLMRELANQIPIRNEEADLDNLSNFNLGNLLPSNKSFFQTLVNNGSVQYISMSNIVDVPIEFFNNMISRVIGSQSGYRQRVNNYVQNTPINPAGTIIFYNENSESAGAGQTLGCNANCQREPVNNQDVPSIGSRSSRNETAEGRPARSRAILGESDEDIFMDENLFMEEECEDEEMWPGEFTKVDAKLKLGLSVGNIIYIILLAFVMVASIPLMFFALYWKFGLTSFREIFSTEFWNVGNAVWISLGLFAIVTLLICYGVEIGIYSSQMKDNKEENKEEKKIEEEIKKQKPWIALIVGSIIYAIILAVIFFLAHKRDFGSSNWTLNSPFAKIKSPFSGNIELTQLPTPSTPNLPTITLGSKLKDLKTANLNTNQGKQIYKDAQNAYKSLSKQHKQVVNSALGSNLLKPSSNISKMVKTGTLDNAAKSAIKSSAHKYDSLFSISPEIKSSILSLAQSDPANYPLQQLASLIQKSQNNILTPQEFNLLLQVTSNPRI